MNKDILEKFVNTVRGKDGSGSNLLNISMGPHLSDALLTSAIIRVRPVISLTLCQVFCRIFIGFDVRKVRARHGEGLDWVLVKWEDGSLDNFIYFALYVIQSQALTPTSKGDSGGYNFLQTQFL